jgi:hypothetical protein
MCYLYIREILQSQGTGKYKPRPMGSILLYDTLSDAEHGHGTRLGMVTLSGDSVRAVNTVVPNLYLVTFAFGNYNLIVDTLLLSVVYY